MWGIDVAVSMSARLLLSVLHPRLFQLQPAGFLPCWTDSFPAQASCLRPAYEAAAGVKGSSCSAACSATSCHGSAQVLV